MVEVLDGVERGEREERVESVLSERVFAERRERKGCMGEAESRPPSLIIAFNISLETGIGAGSSGVETGILSNRFCCIWKCDWCFRKVAQVLVSRPTRGK